jgi:hypothetical protein
MMEVTPGAETVRSGRGLTFLHGLLEDLTNEGTEQSASVARWFSIVHTFGPDEENPRDVTYLLMKSTSPDGLWRYVLDINFPDSDETITIKSIRSK